MPTLIIEIIIKTGNAITKIIFSYNISMIRDNQNQTLLSMIFEVAFKSNGLPLYNP